MSAAPHGRMPAAWEVDLSSDQSGDYEWIPLRLPPDLDFAALFHGVDERVPVDALEFGTRVLEHFLRHC